MERLTDRNTEIPLPLAENADIWRRVWLRLAEYEDTGLEPKEVETIVDRYGRGLTLRTSCAKRIEAIREISDERLQEITQAESDGRLVIRKPPLVDTCGTCIHFQRTPGKASGFCDCRIERKWRYYQVPKMLHVTQSRKQCRRDYRKKDDKSENSP